MPPTPPNNTQTSYTRFYIRKKFIVNGAQMTKLFRESSETQKAQFPKLNMVVGQKSKFRHTYIENA